MKQPPAGTVPAGGSDSTQRLATLFARRLRHLDVTPCQKNCVGSRRQRHEQFTESPEPELVLTCPGRSVVFDISENTQVALAGRGRTIAVHAGIVALSGQRG